MTLSNGSPLAGLAPLLVVAAFDIGSNSIKMTVARQRADRSVEELVSLAETTRLGAGIETTGRLSDESMTASVAVLRDFIASARRFGATRFIGVATEATRVAENGASFLALLKNDLGIEITTVSGDREAALTFLGLPGALRDRGVLLAADIGGASTELIASNDGAIAAAVSYQIGSGRFTDRFIPNDPPTAEDLATSRAATIAAIGDTEWPDPCDRLAILGGTGEFMRRLIGHDWPARNEELENQLDRLTRIKAADLAPVIGASEMRARVLPAGIAIAAGIADVCQPTLVYGAASGIRLGLILETLQEFDQ